MPFRSVVQYGMRNIHCGYYIALGDKPSSKVCRQWLHFECWHTNSSQWIPLIGITYPWLHVHNRYIYDQIGTCACKLLSSYCISEPARALLVNYPLSWPSQLSAATNSLSGGGCLPQWVWPRVVLKVQRGHVLGSSWCSTQFIIENWSVL